MSRLLYRRTDMKLAMDRRSGVSGLSETMNQLIWYTKFIIDEFSKELL
jgi:hypothetical protein